MFLPYPLLQKIMLFTEGTVTIQTWISFKVWDSFER